MATRTLQSTRTTASGRTVPGVVTIEILSDDFTALREVIEQIRLEYIETAEEAVSAYLGDDPKTYVVTVDGVTPGDLNNARLNGSGIVASRVGDITALKKAYAAARARLSVGISQFFRPTGQYESSITVKVNGRQVAEIDWARVTPRSNIQIFSPVRYATPLEALKAGNLLFSAANAALAAGGSEVKVSFGYSTGRKLGLSKPGGTLPFIEMGTISSNVVQSIQTPGKGRKRRRRK